jgi:hypothetical protein
VAKVIVQHVSGAYSSGSVQDLHLIPFSLLFRSNYETDNTNISDGKGRDLFLNPK